MILFAGIVLPADSIIQVYFPQIMINLLSKDRPFINIIVVAAVFEVFLLLITFLDDLYSNVLGEIVDNKISPKINSMVYEKSAKTKYCYIDNPDYYNNFTWAIKDYASKSKAAINLLSSIITAIITISSLVVVIASNNVWIVLIISVSFLLKFLTVKKINALEISKDEEMIPLNRRLNYCHRMFYLNNYAMEIRTTKLKEIVLKHYNKTVSDKSDLIKKYIKKSLCFLILNDVLVRLSEFLIVLSIANSIFQGRIADVGAYVTLFMASEKLNQVFFTVFDLFRSWNKLSVYGGKIREFFSYDDEIKNTCGISANSEPFSVDFKNVSFKYQDADFCVSNLNFSINHGEKIAIVGKNGAGKSTLIKLMLGLYEPKSGEILINGEPLKSYNIDSLRGEIGVAFQNTNVFALSMDENLRIYGEVDASIVDAVERKFGIDKILLKNNAINETMLTREFDKNGIMMSDGEAQKMALSRLALRKFGLLLLDEPSSALDPIAEYDMNKLLIDSSEHTTTIMIAHRLSTVKNMDRILVMDNGSIIECGTHDSLMTRKGIYYEMFTKQSENYS